MGYAVFNNNNADIKISPRRYYSFVCAGYSAVVRHSAVAGNSERMRALVVVPCAVAGNARISLFADKIKSVIVCILLGVAAPETVNSLKRADFALKLIVVIIKSAVNLGYACGYKDFRQVAASDKHRHTD